MSQARRLALSSMSGVEAVSEHRSWSDGPGQASNGDRGWQWQRRVQTLYESGPSLPTFRWECCRLHLGRAAQLSLTARLTWTWAAEVNRNSPVSVDQGSGSSPYSGSKTEPRHKETRREGADRMIKGSTPRLGLIYLLQIPCPS